MVNKFYDVLELGKSPVVPNDEEGLTVETLDLEDDATLRVHEEEDAPPTPGSPMEAVSMSMF
jgi:hypothetical protein